MPLEVTIDSTTWAALALTLTIIGGALAGWPGVGAAWPPGCAVWRGRWYRWPRG